MTKKNYFPNTDAFEADVPILQRCEISYGYWSGLAFGVGGSGLTRDAQDILAKFLRFDYMDDQRCENGALGACLEFMASNLADYEVTEDDGFWFLCHANHTVSAHPMWRKFRDGPAPWRERARTTQRRYVAWFDFRNALFIARGELALDGTDLGEAKVNELIDLLLAPDEEDTGRYVETVVSLR